MMALEEIYREATHKTPKIQLKPDGFIVIQGSSTPIDAAEFYFDILDWLTDYFRSPQENTSVKIELEHINSASANMIYRFFHLLNRLSESEKSTVRCIWTFDVEDEFMIEFLESIEEVAPLVMFISQPRSVEFVD